MIKSQDLNSIVFVNIIFLIRGGGKTKLKIIFRAKKALEERIHYPLENSSLIVKI